MHLVKQLESSWKHFNYWHNGSARYNRYTCMKRPLKSRANNAANFNIELGIYVTDSIMFPKSQEISTHNIICKKTILKC